MTDGMPRQPGSHLSRGLLIVAVLLVVTSAIPCVFYAGHALRTLPMFPPIAYAAATMIHVMALGFLLSANADDQARMRGARPLLLGYSVVMGWVAGTGFADLHPDSPGFGIVLGGLVAVAGPIFIAMAVPRVGVRGESGQD